MDEIEQLKQALGLRPLPEEGGFFAESYRSGETLQSDCLRQEYAGERSLSTAIYFLLTADTFSALHRLKSDEIYHFYLGDPAELLLLRPDGSGEISVLGTDLVAGMRPQIVVPRGTWQGSRVRPGGRFALLGTTVSPGFELADREMGNRDALLHLYPQFAGMIREL